MIMMDDCNFCLKLLCLLKYNINRRKLSYLLRKTADVCSGWLVCRDFNFISWETYNLTEFGIMEYLNSLTVQSYS